jgi:PST family polysaccharide transporter
MPALSRLVDQPERYRSMFRQIMQKLALLTMPVFAFAAMLADWVVQILFGPSWTSATPLVAWFCLSAACLPVLLAAGLLYMTQGRTVELVRATLIDGALCVASILVGLKWGVVGVAASIALAGLLVRLPLAFWLASRRGPVSVGHILSAIAPAVSAALAAAAAAWALRHYAFPEAMPTVTGMLLVGAGGLAAMALAVLAWPETRRELRNAGRSLLGTGPSGGAAEVARPPP